MSTTSTALPAGIPWEVGTTSQKPADLYGSYGWVEGIKNISYGPGSLSTVLPELLSTFGAKKALIVTGKSLRYKTDVVTKVEEVLKKHDAYADTFSEIGEHAPIGAIRKGVEVFKQSGADIFIGLGGGSPVDSVKAMVYFLHEEAGPGAPFLKQIAIPTTLSAAEYTVNAGFTNEQGDKHSVAAQQLVPSAILLDGELTLATPERLWLSTGMRALDHAVENLYRPIVPRPLHMLCYGAIAHLFKYLPLSKAEPQNVEFRQKLQVASWMSIFPQYIPRPTALGLSHSLGHRLGATYSIPHGITSCLTLAPTVAYQAKYASQDHKQALADALFYLRIPTTGSLDGDVERFAAEIDGLVQKLGLKTNLAECKVPHEDVPKIASKVLNGTEHPAYPHVVDLLEGLYPK